MALFDKVKEQASQLAQKAQEAGKAGQAKIEDVQARRKSDGILRQLGAAVYAQRSGTADADNGTEIDRLVAELKAFEAENGPIAAKDSGDDGTSPSSGATDTPPDADTPEGGFKL
ncbi:MAG TPA: hypothetical protein VG246_06605 [Acidimicrobiales bacterium]|jgi:hypothetical protein|nr:hypothetical protein [Acidimicrobiales bacterium]